MRLVYDDEITKTQIQNVIDNLQMLLEEMEEAEINSVRVDCNTYGMRGHFISFPGKGFLELQDDYYDLIEQKLEEEEY